jgi:hypothetical protein
LSLAEIALLASLQNQKDTKNEIESGQFQVMALDGWPVASPRGPGGEYQLDLSGGSDAEGDL